MKSGIDVSRIDPEFLMMLADPVAGVYEAIEHDLLVNLAKRFDGGKRIPKSLVPGSTAWRAFMLEQMGALTRENIRLIARYSGDVSELTQLAVRTGIETAISAVEPELAKAVAKPEYIPQRSEMVQRVMEAYTGQAINKYNMVNTVLLNSSLRAYEQLVGDTVAYQTRLDQAQRTLNEETGVVIMGTKSRQTAVRDAVKRMAAEGLTGFTDAAGRNWSAQAYVEMDIRTTSANAAREAVMQRNADYGNSLISVSSHPGARPKCYPYQGKVYSTDGTSGTTTDLHGRVIAYTPLSGTSYGEPDGLFGINCHHMSSPFLPGLSLIRDKPEGRAENERLYKASQEQRYMERKIRQVKTQADALAAAGDPESLAAAKELRGKARTMNAELQEWCEANERDYSPERVRVIRARK